MVPQVLYIVEPPDQIIRLALQKHGVALNLRPRHWPPRILEKTHADTAWCARAKRHSGKLVYPDLTETLKQLKPGVHALVCRQDPDGGIVTVANSLREIRWLNASDAEKTGVNAKMSLACGEAFWADQILAISKVSSAAALRRVRDPQGTHFVRTFNEFSI